MIGKDEQRDNDWHHRLARAIQTALAVGLLTVLIWLARRRAPDLALALFFLNAGPTFVVAYYWRRRAGLALVAALLFLAVLLLGLAPPANGDTPRLTDQPWLFALEMGASALLFLFSVFVGERTSLQRRLRVRYHALDELGEHLGQKLQADEIYPIVLERAIKIFGATGGEITVRDEATAQLTVVAGANFSRQVHYTPQNSPQAEPSLPRAYAGASLAELVLRRNEPFLRNDLANDPHFTLTPDRTWPVERIHSTLAAPLRRGGDAFGLICLFRATRDFGPFDARFLTAIAEKATIALENARLFHQTDADLARRVEELSVLNRVTQALVSSLELGQTLNTILQALRELCPYAMAEICLWEPVNQVMRSYAWSGAQEYADAAGGFYRLDEGYSGWIARHRRPLWIPDAATCQDPRPKIDRHDFPFRSYVGLPLQVGQQLIGTLEMVSFEPDAFSTANEAMLEALCNQAAVAIQNARLYQERQQRLAEMVGLQQISQTISAMRDVGQVYRVLTERIAQLMNVELCGVLLHDPETQALISRPPFYGVASELIQNYRIPVPPGSPMGHIWQQSEYWYSNDVLNDPLTDLVGLREVAVTSGVRSTLFVALAAGDRRFGIIQVSNKRDGSSFDESDARLLAIFAHQAAVVVENAQLYERDQERRRLMEALQTSVTDISAALNLDEAVQRVAERAADTFHLAAAAVLTLKPELKSITVAAAVGLSEDFTATHRLALEQLLDHWERYGTHPWLFRGVELESIVAARLIQSEDLAWAAVVPLLSGNEPFGMLQCFGQENTPPLTPDQMEMIALFAHQSAIAIENARLYTQTDASLGQRLDELTILNRIGQELNASLDLEHILELVLNEAVRATHASHGNVNLMNWDTGVLEARSIYGFAPDDAPQREISLIYGRGVIGRAAQTARPVVVDDVMLDPDYVAITPDTRSEVAVPILHRGVVLGVINLESPRTGGFTEAHIGFLETLAAQAAVAINNARTYEAIEERSELMRQRTEQLSRLFEIAQTMRTDRPLEDVLTEVAFAVQETVGYNIALISVREGHLQRRVAAAGIPIAEFERMQRVHQPWAGLESLFREEFRISNSYYIPYERTEVTQHLDVFRPETGPVERQAGQWHPDDMLLVPLKGSGDVILGLLSVDQPRDNRVPDRTTIEALEIFAAQAALAIENTHLVDDLTRRVDELTLFNEVAHSISTRLDLQGLFDTVVEAAAELLNAPRSFLFLQDPNDEQPVFVPRCVRGYEHISALRYRSGEGLVGRVVETATAIVITDAQQDERYSPVLPDAAGTPSLDAEHTLVSSVILVPLIYGGRIVGVLGADHWQPFAFSNADITSLAALADQAAIAAENASLFEQTQRQLQEMSALNQIGHALSATVDMDELLAVLREQVARLVPTESFYVALYDETTDQISFPLFIRHDEPASIAPISANQGLTGHIIRTRQPLLLAANAQAALEKLGLPWLGNPARSYLGVPMLLGEKVVGVIAVQDFERDHVFDPGHERALSTVAVQAAIAIQNARLYKETLNRARQLSQLNEAARSISFELEMARVLQTASQQMANLLNASGCVISDWDHEQNAVQAISEYPHQWGSDPAMPTVYPLDEYPATRHVLVERAIVQVHAADPQADRAEMSWMKMAGVTSVLMLPLVVGDRVVGLLELLYESHHPFSEAELNLAQTLANQAAVSIENARLFEQVRSYRDELEQRVEERTAALEDERDRVETLYRITSDLSASLDLDRVLNRALALVLEVVKAERSSIFMLDPQIDRIVHRATLWAAAIDPANQKQLPYGGAPIRFRRGEGLVGWVMSHKKPVIVDDIRQDPRWVEEEDHEREHRSVIAVPLIVSDEAMGALFLFHSRVGNFTPAHLRLVEAVASQVAAAINNSQLYGYVRESADRLGWMIRSQQEETAKTEAILEGVADGVMVSDAKGVVIRFNAAAERILNTPRGEVLGRTTDELLGLYGPAGAAWAKAIDRWRHSPPQPGEEALFAERMEIEDRIVSVLLSPLTTRFEFLGAVSLFRDVTQEVELERAKSEFISTVSHELRTPMTSIKGYADLLIMGAAGPLNENQARFLSIIKTNADRLTMLVNDLLDIGRIDTQRLELNLKEVELGSAVQIVVESLHGRAVNKRQTLDTHIPADLPPVWADRDRLVQILTNLVSNAQQYTPTGGHVTLTAHLCLERRDGSRPLLLSDNGEWPAGPNMVQVNITDDGIGIAPEEQEKIFERFFRSDHPLVQETPGTGLGLPITCSLVEMHGGRLWVESQVGQGSTFSFTLPLAQTELERSWEGISTPSKSQEMRVSGS
jgi:GAF domain-containing protein